jgi:DNA-binding beta-propeller fold protein YncE
MLRSLVFVLSLSPALAGGLSAYADFVPGRVYLSYFQNDLESGPRIMEFDPATGESRQFFRLENAKGPFHGLTGLAFTPNGAGLRTADSFYDRVLEIDADANDRVVLDGNDGLDSPSPLPGLAYAANGDFFVANSDTSQILRFPADGGAGQVFATAQRLGPIALGSDGIVYSGRSRGRDVYRYSSAGVPSPFDQLPSGQEILSMATKPDGDLFVRTVTSIFRYAGGEPSARVELAQVPTFLFASLALSPDGTQLYTERLYDLLSIDIQTGAITNLGMLPFVDRWYPGAGMAVYIPEPATGFQLALAATALLIRKR